MTKFPDLRKLSSATQNKLLVLANATLEDKLELLHGACAIYGIVRECGISDEEPFQYLWALDSSCRELPMDESCRLGRHPDLLARQDNELRELAEYYRKDVIATCQVLKQLLNND
jgi:hypothetical protein